MTDRRHIVITDQAHGLPYSKGLMASSLMVAGVPPGEAFRVAESIEEDLLTSGRVEVTSDELRKLAATILGEVGEEYATAYLKWQAVEELDVPLVILLGGATGVGKSTLATRLAVRLGISRVVSTDAIREVLRAAFSKELMPTLHASSYEADTALQVPVPRKADALIIGFQRQVSAVSVGIKALIARALEERTDIIIEGAHIVPGFLEGWEQEFKDAVLVHVVVAVGDEDLHRSHFYRRAIETRLRPRDRYLASFKKIRAIQSYVKDLANEREVPIVEMFDLDSALQEIVSIVVDKALASAQVRGEVRDQLEEALDDGKVAPNPARTRIRGWQIVSGKRRNSE